MNRAANEGKDSQERGGMVLYACLPSLKSIGAALKDKNEFTFCVEKQQSFYLQNLSMFDTDFLSKLVLNKFE